MSKEREIPDTFAPLHPHEIEGVLGYRSSATSLELYDEALMRQNAVLGVLAALSGESLSELSSDLLDACLRGIEILASDGAALHRRAYEGLSHSAYRATSFQVVPNAGQISG